MTEQITEYCETAICELLIYLSKAGLCEKGERFFTCFLDMNIEPSDFVNVILRQQASVFAPSVYLVSPNALENSLATYSQVMPIGKTCVLGFEARWAVGRHISSDNLILLVQFNSLARGQVCSDEGEPCQLPSLVLVCLESPYAGDFNRNTNYARACMRHSLSLGEAPFASHMLYPRVLHEHIPEQREQGITAGLAWAACAQRTVVYIDLGISPGMWRGIENARAAGREVVFRLLPGVAKWNGEAGSQACP